MFFKSYLSYLEKLIALFNLKFTKCWFAYGSGKIKWVAAFLPWNLHRYRRQTPSSLLRLGSKPVLKSYDQLFCSIIIIGMLMVKTPSANIKPSYSGWYNPLILFHLHYFFFSSPMWVRSYLKFLPVLGPVFWNTCRVNLGCSGCNIHCSSNQGTPNYATLPFNVLYSFLLP